MNTTRSGSAKFGKKAPVPGFRLETNASGSCFVAASDEVDSGRVASETGARPQMFCAPTAAPPPEYPTPSDDDERATGPARPSRERVRSTTSPRAPRMQAAPTYSRGARSEADDETPETARGWGFRTQVPSVEDSASVSSTVTGARRVAEAPPTSGRARREVRPEQASPSPREEQEFAPVGEPEVTVTEVATLPQVVAPSRSLGPRRIPKRAWALGAVVALLVGGLGLYARFASHAPVAPVADASRGPLEPARLSSSGQSRLFDRGMDGTLQKYLANGYYVAVERNEDGTLSNRLIYEDMMSKDLTAVQELARIKSENLEKPLFIIGGSPPQVVDRVNPDDRKARREYMMLVWTLKQESLDWSRQRYLSREALEPHRTVVAMSRFIESYPNSRMVGSALKDMRHACYVGLQDPAKFRQVIEGLVDRALASARPGVDGAPELARVVLPYLKDAVNQVLYQRIHRLESALKPAGSGAQALQGQGASATRN